MSLDSGAAYEMVNFLQLARLGHDPMSLGLEEVLAGPGVKAVEWAERLPFPVAGACRLRFERKAPGERLIHLENDD